MTKPKQNMIDIFKFSHFLPDESGHGGNRRSAQINYLLLEAGINFRDIVLEPHASVNKFRSFLRGIWYYKNIKTDLKSTYATGNQYYKFTDFLRRQKQVPMLFIMEATSDYNLMMTELLKKNQIPCILLPHNLESLVPGNTSVFSAKKSPTWLMEEVKYLKLCDCIFTISREEAWLLSLMGIDSKYLPYYPTPKIEAHLLEIRKKRTHIPNKDKREVLLLGTFYNKPTLDGYKDLITNISKNSQIKITVAGYGSEILSNYFKGTDLEILGGVSDDELAHLMTKCDFAIVHQQPTSGALTRIIEMLIAGVPVLANSSAARSYYNNMGIMVYDTFDELSSFLNVAFETAPIPKRPSEEKAFVDKIKEYILNSTTNGQE